MIQKKIKAVLIFLGISVCLSIPSSFLVGIILPVTVEQVKTKSFYVAKPMLWYVLSDLDSYPIWKPELRDIEYITDGIKPVQFTEYIQAEKRKEWQVLSWEPQKKLEIKLAPSKRYIERMVYTIREQEETLLLSLRFSGTYINPFRRFLKRFVHHQGKQLDAILIGVDEQLKRLSEELDLGSN